MRLDNRLREIEAELRGPMRRSHLLVMVLQAIHSLAFVRCHRCDLPVVSEQTYAPLRRMDKKPVK